MPHLRSILPRGRRRGAVAVLVAVCLTVLMGVVALSIDGGLLLQERRRAQATADAAALAAADDLFKNYNTNLGKDPSGSAAASARTVAKANGYSNDGTTSVVTVNIPPTSGNFAGQDGAAEVIVQYNHKRYFSSVFGSSDLPVKARAVARARWTTLKNGIIVLDRSTKGALTIGGNGTIKVQGAPVIVNSSNSTAALTLNGSNAVLSAPEIDIVGGYALNGGATGNNLDGTVDTGVRPVPDPLRYLPAPDKNSLPTGIITSASQPGGGKLYTLTPGVYKGGLSFSSQDSVVMQPGIYYMDAGGFSFSGQGSLTAAGVMIYNDPTANSQQVSITGQGNVTLSPPISGTYKGISIFQNRNANVNLTITGNGKFNITGTIYAADASASISGNGDVSLGSQYISRLLAVNGNGGFNITWNTSPLPSDRVLGLVE